MAVHVGGDDSFSEYVSVRWSVVYRLAVLLVGDERADQLTQDAFVRVHASWRHVQQAPSVDAAVKEILARMAVSDGSPDLEPELPAATADREELWRRLTRLPVRARAVVVLLHYEDLTEREIARALGSSVKVVRADAAALDGVLPGFTTEDLHDELVVRADEADVQLPPTDSLISRGHDERRRRVRRSLTWSAGVAAAVVAGVTLASVLQGSAADPAPDRPRAVPALPRSLDRLPPGPPAQIGYAVGSALHLSDGREIALTGTPTALATTTSGLYVALRSGRILRLESESGTLETVTDSSAGQLVSDPSGVRIAWLEARPGTASVVVGSVGPAGGALLGRARAFPAVPRCCDDPFVIDGITGGAELVASAPGENRAWVWDTRAADARVREISGLGNGVVSQVIPSGIVVQHLPYQYAAGQLVGDDFLVTDEIAAAYAEYDDPLAERVVFSDHAGEVHVRERVSRGSTRTPTDVRLGLPSLEQGFAGARWEDADHVLLDVRDDSVPDGALVRCDAHSGACQLIVRFGGPHLLAR